MNLNGVEIEETFAEAFPMTAGRAVITAETAAWALTAARVATGYATSVIACDSEAGIERALTPGETPDGRPGVSVLLFAFSRERLQRALIGRIGQAVLTCPTTACYDGLPETDREKRVRVGGELRYFGDGHQASKKLERRRFWRIPVMDGEFLCEDRFGTVKGVAGGNFLVIARTQQAALAASEAAVAVIGDVADCILPFPGGIVRSGSKVGSRYKALKASTNDAYCPTLRGSVESKLPKEAGAVYEIVIDALTGEAVRRAMAVGIQAACGVDVLRISAGNYGGKLGPHHFHLHEILSGAG